MNKLINKFLKIVFFPYDYIKYRLLNFILKKYNSKKKFNLIYKTNYWKSSFTGSRSGRGSDLETTFKIRESLMKFISDQNIKSILDIPCGDYYWMSKLDLNKLIYIGADIVKELVKNNNKKYKNPNINFLTLDIVKDKLPNVDLIFSRDCLVHLDNEEITLALNNVKKTGSIYFATTIFEKNFNNDTSALSDNWRPINLTKKPFNLNTPDFIIDDSNNNQLDKKIAIWKISNL